MYWGTKKKIFLLGGIKNKCNLFIFFVWGGGRSLDVSFLQSTSMTYQPYAVGPYDAIYIFFVMFDYIFSDLYRSCVRALFICRGLCNTDHLIPFFLGSGMTKKQQFWHCFFFVFFLQRTLCGINRILFQVRILWMPNTN